jgi:hypothetical protein
MKVLILPISALIGLAVGAAYHDQWWVAAFVLGLAAFGLFTAWVYRAYRASVEADGDAPPWLRALERLRCYLANEDPDAVLMAKPKTTREPIHA